MTPTQPIAPDYAAAWDRLSDVVASEMGPVPDLALIEPGIRILELAAAYREAHATYVEAVASERAAYLVSTNDPGLASAACTALASGHGGASGDVEGGGEEGLLGGRYTIL